MRRARRSTSTSCWRSASAPARRPEAVPTTTAVLAAAGSGLRLGAGGPKALAELGGRPMLAWSLDALAAASAIAEIVVAAPAGNEAEIEALMRSIDGPPQRVVTGGETRSESVALAVKGATGELVAVHDAARPLVTAEAVDGLVEVLLERPDVDGVIAAGPLTDTIKRAREPRPEKGEFPRGGPTIAKTESRDHLWAAQTPQVFRAAALERAMKEASPDRLREATDEAMLVERTGGKVLMREVPGPNLKVTSPDDLRLAEILLSHRTAAGS